MTARSWNVLRRLVGGRSDEVTLAHVDAHTAEIVRKVMPFTMTSAARVLALCEAVRYIVDNRIPGDIVECGVWRGGSMMAVAHSLLDVDERMPTLYLFDTFEGMPPPTGADIAITGESAKDLMEKSDRSDPRSVWCVASLEDVSAALLGTGYDPARIRFVKGRVEETVPSQAPERIALLRLDTDWYESTKHELEHLYPRLVPGGVLIIDDYGHWTGAKRAVDEYLKEHGVPLLLQRIDYTGRCAIKWRS
jgi:O-methyltransferase